MRKYTFPANRNDIDQCYDVEQLTKWKHEFEATIQQMDLDYGGIENMPENLYKYGLANKYNLKQILFKIRKLTGPVSSIGALKCFHDVVKELFPNEYGSLVIEAKKRLGKSEAHWDELIKKHKV